ncbi:hypothetical protein [Bacillus thuringiensis]|nr:hypothetical protein [Bacillus thuringiensis]
MSFVLEMGSLLKGDFLFLYGGVLQMIDHYQIFLITMTGISLFFYI